MRPLITFALTAVLTITFSSCSTEKINDQHGFKQQLGWTVSREKHLPQVGWNVDTLCSYTCKDGHSRLFVDVFYHVADSYYEEYHGLYAVDDLPRDTTFIQLKYPRYEDEEDEAGYMVEDIPEGEIDPLMNEGYEVLFYINGKVMLDNPEEE